MELARLHLQAPNLQQQEFRFSGALKQLLQVHAGAPKLLVACIGTPRNAGDSLGPLAGTLLLRRLGMWRPGAPALEVQGTLEDPIHATNLAERAPALKRPGTFVLAVDASVGRPGEVILRQGPLAPGAGLGRQLPALGDAHILCGVAPAALGFFSAHLGEVLNMAELVGRAVLSAALAMRKVS